MRVHEVEQNTLQGYEQYARRYIKPALGDVPVGKVTAKMLEDFYRAAPMPDPLRRSARGGPPRRRTPRMQSRPAPPPTRQATSPWLPRARLRAGRTNRDGRMGAGRGLGQLVWLVMVIGLRRAELLGLKWLDVDLAGGKLTIRRNYVRVAGQLVEKDTKTHTRCAASRSTPPPWTC